MQIKWSSYEALYAPNIRGTVYEGKAIDKPISCYIALDMDLEEGCISLFLIRSTCYIPFKFSQIPGEQNDPDLLVLAHQLIEKEIQTLKDNGRF